MAREIVLGKDGKAEAVSYIDKTTRSEKRVRARAFVVAASACESARLLVELALCKLSQWIGQFFGGRGTLSHRFGRQQSDAGYFPQLEKMPAHNHDGVGGMHMYMPWWRFGQKNDFLRGYHIEFGGGRDMPGVGEFEGVCAEHEGYGVSLKQKCRSSYGTVIGFSGRGEMIPNENSFCEIDPNVVDKWGIPVLRFHWQWGENELKMAADMQETFRSIIETAGGTVLGQSPRPATGSDTSRASQSIPYLRAAPSSMNSARCAWGTIPKTSALNENCQAHDVKNLFVADAAPFVTNPDKNPTLTIMALSWRTSDYLLDQAKKGEL